MNKGRGTRWLALACGALWLVLIGTAPAWAGFWNLPDNDGTSAGSGQSPWNVPDPDGGGGGGDPAPVPEIDPGMASGGIVLVAGSVLLLLERRRRR